MKKNVIALILTLCSAFAVGQNVATKKQEISKPFVLGEIIELKSKVLSEQRILNVYLPDGYNPNDSIKYPVTYLLDGSADEDFIHVVGLFQFNNFSWINRVPKSIVVGIGNVDRRRDFTYPTTIAEEQKRNPTSENLLILFPLLKQNCSHILKKNTKQIIQKLLLGNLSVGF